eukprot:2497828-Pyramimonas_sp.AAC.1
MPRNPLGHCEDDATVRPCAKDRAPWPAAGATPTPLGSICSEAAHDRVGSWRARMLVPGSTTVVRRRESGLAKHCVDPRFLSCPSRYADLLRRLDEAGMPRFRVRRGRGKPTVR